MDLDSKEKLLKAKDGYIFELINTIEMQSNRISFRENEYQKARSIVAMLFWEWRKAKIKKNETNTANKTRKEQLACDEFLGDKYNDGACFKAILLFKKAYAILKDKQC
jgi:hypothetical protein